MERKYTAEVTSANEHFVNLKLELPLSRGMLLDVWTRGPCYEAKKGEKVELELKNFDSVVSSAFHYPISIGNQVISPERIPIDLFPVEKAREVLKYKFDSFRLCGYDSDTFYKAIGCLISELFASPCCPKYFKQSLLDSIEKAKKTFPGVDYYLDSYLKNVGILSRKDNIEVSNFYAIPESIQNMVYTVRVLIINFTYQNKDNHDYSELFTKSSEQLIEEANTSFSTELVKFLAKGLQICIKIVHLDSGLEVSSFNQRSAGFEFFVAYAQNTYHPLFHKKQTFLEKNSPEMLDLIVKLEETNSVQPLTPAPRVQNSTSNSQELVKLLTNVILENKVYINEEHQNQLQTELSKCNSGMSFLTPLEDHIKQLALEKRCKHSERLKVQFPCGRKHCKTCVMSTLDATQCFCGVEISEEQKSKIYNSATVTIERNSDSSTSLNELSNLCQLCKVTKTPESFQIVCQHGKICLDCRKNNFGNCIACNRHYTPQEVQALIPSSGSINKCTGCGAAFSPQLLQQLPCSHTTCRECMQSAMQIGYSCITCSAMMMGLNTF